MRILLLSALLLTAAASARADGLIDTGSAPARWEDAEPNTELGRKVLGVLGEEALHGRLIFNQRLRYEYAEQQGLEASNAFTLRTRVGYETPKFYGLYMLAEFENNWSINGDDYRPYPVPQGPPTQTVIPDPRNNEINQLFLGFSGFNNGFKGGRQVINLDNQRFVGAVDWRQNDQTYDAVRWTSEMLQDTWVSYAWNWRVNRIFGVYPPAGYANLERFESNNHFFNVHYEGLPVGTLGAYFYYLDLEQAAAVSGSTAGLFYEATIKLDDNWSLPVRLEYAFQTDNSGSRTATVQDFWFNYGHVSVAGKYKGLELGISYEYLGGNSQRAFQTPLATLHKFNGQADVFLTTPTTSVGGGLQDYRVFVNAPLPWKIQGFGSFHYFTAADTSTTWGHEVDVGIKRKFTENLTGLVKFAQYWGSGSSANVGALASNVTKVWVQVDFSL
ncbi:alginate export family protein [Ruficoccus amylovorans]|uniref:Alginate export family protein n=1 Tax=Ruficoccus amylovorans TaxID=1804625 RepID=A0A842HIQ8_9BACT|nr:alginate export family protein [Ruficoccus amylovorans]MBC2595476.1 alginate export family protein [Ruficoccus amylovorans]